jgi:hypothetical protein
MDELIHTLFDAEVLLVILLHDFAHSLDDLIGDAAIFTLGTRRRYIPLTRTSLVAARLFVYILTRPRSL